MLTNKQLSSKIAGIRKSTATIRANIQTVLINVAGHAYEHGDVTALTKLLDATKGVDKDAILRFATEHCFVRVKKDEIGLDKTARKNADFANGAEVVAHLDENAPKWYDTAVTTEQAIKALDIEAQLASLAKRIAKAEQVKTIDMKAFQDKFEDVVGAYNTKVESGREHETH